VGLSAGRTGSCSRTDIVLDESVFHCTLVAMPVQKDTPKAIVIILLCLALLAGLLAAANHFRPHP